MNRKGGNRTRLVAFAILWLGALYDWLAFRQYLRTKAATVGHVQPGVAGPGADFAG
ncbi:MAG: hypothetical protein ACR2JX_07575 [Mycobacteriales bacterium]